MINIKKELSKNRISKIILIISIISFVLFIISQKKYYALIFSLCGVYSIAITGLDILFGYSGQISFGHAAFFAVGAYTSAIISTRYSISPIITMIFGVLLSVLIGLLIAIPASKLVKHFLSLITIAFGQIVYLILNTSREITGGGTGITRIPDIDLLIFKIDENIEYAIFVWLIVLLVFLLKKRIVESKIGLAFLAIKENTIAASGLGINVRKYKIMAFAISAGIAGLAGALYSHLMGFISPDTFNSAQSTLFLTMLLFGGTCSYLGPIVGSIVLIFIREFLQEFSRFQTLIYGVFLLIVLFYFPNGIVSLIKKINNTFIKKVKRKNTYE